MPTIKKSMQVPELALTPPIEGVTRLSEDMQQTLALLCGYRVNKRVLLQVTDDGFLYTTPGRLVDVKHISSVDPAYLLVMPNIGCAEVLVMGHPDNTKPIWVRTKGTALTTNALPIDAKETFKFGVRNTNELSILTEVFAETAILAIAR